MFHCRFSIFYAAKVRNFLQYFVPLHGKIDNEDDHRSFLIGITEEGKDLTKKYVEEYVKETEFLAEKLGQEKAQMLKELLEESREILNNYGK